MVESDTWTRHDWRTTADGRNATTKKTPPSVGIPRQRKSSRRPQPVREDVIAALSTATREIEVVALRSEVTALKQELGALRGRVDILEAAFVAAKPSRDEFQWLAEVYKLTGESRYDQAIDVLFENVDDLGLDACDRFLRVVDLNRLEAHLLVGVLSITLSRAADLPYRPKVVELVERRLQEIAPERVARLMNGLR